MAGALGWLKVLRESGSLLEMLIWLYVILAAVAGSIVFAGMALIDLTRRLRAERKLRGAFQPDSSRLPGEPAAMTADI